MPLCGTHSDGTEPPIRVTTKRARISQLSVENQKMVFRQLMHHFSKKSQRQWYHELSGRAAQGTDGISKIDYGVHLQENLKTLHDKLKQMSYRPSSVRQIWIPKDGQSKKLRPLGISNIVGIEQNLLKFDTISQWVREARRKSHLIKA